MAKEKGDDPPDDRVINLTEAKSAVRDADVKITKALGTRTTANEKISTARAGVEEHGVPKAAFDLAMRLKKMDPHVRRAFDLGLAIARETLEIPEEADLLEGLEGDAAGGNGRRKPKGASAEAAH